MRKKYISSLLIILTVISVTITGYNFNNTNKNGIDSSSSRMVSEDCIEEDKALSLYRKYFEKISDIYSKYNLDVRNLKEDNSNQDFVTRVVLTEAQDVDFINNTWFGLTYQDDVIRELSFYMDGNLDSYTLPDGSYSIESSIIQDIGDVFFSRKKFTNDVNNFLNNASSEPGMNTTNICYKKGTVNVSLNAHKLSIKIILK